MSFSHSRYETVEWQPQGLLEPAGVFVMCYVAYEVTQNQLFLCGQEYFFSILSSVYSFAAKS